MATYLNHAAVAAPRNGATTHTVKTDGTGGTVVDGVAFTAAAGRLLVCFVEGSATSTTPTGWTLPTNGSAIQSSALYVFHRTASGTSADDVATTHNASDYPVMFDFYEFGAGSTFNSAATAIGVSQSGGAGPTLSGLTGTNWTAGIVGQTNGSAVSTQSTTWDLGTEEVDHSTMQVTTDGYTYSLTYVADNVASSAAYAATVTGPAPTERLVIAVTVASAVALPGTFIEFTKVL